jgi:hypothetical protein
VGVAGWWLGGWVGVGGCVCLLRTLQHGVCVYVLVCVCVSRTWQHAKVCAYVHEREREGERERG